MPVPDHFESYILWINLLVIFLTTPLFILVLCSIARKLNSVFDTGFWRIFLSLGFASLLHSWGDVVIRLMAIGNFGRRENINDIWAKVLMINHWLTNFSQTTGKALLSVNRFLSIFHSAPMELIQPCALFVVGWNGLIEILVQWISSFILVTPMFFMDFKFVSVWNGTGYTLSAATELWETVYYPVHGTKLCIEVCLHVICYSAMLRKIKSDLQGGGHTNDYEKRLTIAGLWISCLTCVNASCSVLMILLETADVKQAQLLMLDTVDMVVSMSQPYILLALSSVLRQHLIIPLCGKPTAVAPTPKVRTRPNSRKNSPTTKTVQPKPNNKRGNNGNNQLPVIQL